MPPSSSTFAALCLALLLALPLAVAIAQEQTSTPEAPRARLLVAPRAFDALVPEADRDAQARFVNLYYRADNDGMRGSRLPTGLWVDDGEAIAEAWRRLAGDVRGVFALRDSLYAQQDHPLGNEPYATTLPPSWITAAAAAAARGESLARPTTPGLLDDASWAALSQEQLFGGFPADELLFDRAGDTTQGRSESERLRVLNARRTLRQLGQQASALVDVSGDGPEAVAARGAELISEGDRAYFGDALRRERLVLIALETPSSDERARGAGFAPPENAGESGASDELVTLVRDTVLRRRMADGEIGLGTYDLADPAVRAHLIAVLRGLIPRGDPVDTGFVWVVFDGAAGPDGRRTAALEAVATFKREARAALVNTGRMDFLPAEALALPEGAVGAEVLEGALASHAGARVMLPLDLDGAATRALIEAASGTPVALAPVVHDAVAE